MSRAQLSMFRLIEPIGAGATATVWRARHPDGDEVAIKVLTSKDNIQNLERQTMYREVLAIASLRHPSIVNILDTGIVPLGIPSLVPGSQWVATELAEHGDLQKYAPMLQWKQILIGVTALLDGLAHAHAQGIVHRDIKPANILIGNGGQWKLGDFGISHFLSEGQGQVNIAGTPRYMAPEQFLGIARLLGPPVDLYALGCVVWELVTGQSPFFKYQSYSDLMYAHRWSKLPPFIPRISIPEGLGTWLKILLRKQSIERFSCAADASWALQQLKEPKPQQQSGCSQSPDPNKTQNPKFNLPNNPLPHPTHQHHRIHQFASNKPSPREELFSPATGDLTIPVTPKAKKKQPPPTNAPASARLTAPPSAPIPDDWRAPTQPRQYWLRGTGPALFNLQTPPLVGRTVEQDILWHTLHKVKRSEMPHFVLLHGALGYGKSRLAMWLSRRALELGAASPLICFHTNNTPEDGLIPMLRRAMKSQGLQGEKLDKLLSERTTGLEKADQVWLAQILDPKLNTPSPQITQAVLLRWITAQATTRPLVLVLEDLQLGSLTLNWIERLMDTQAPVLIIGSITTNNLQNSLLLKPPLTHLIKHPRAETLHIGRLGFGAERALLRSLIDLDESMLARITSKTAGNPLFARELVRDGITRGIFVEEGKGFTLRRGAELHLPNTIQEMLSCSNVLSKLRSDLLLPLLIAALLGHEIQLSHWTRSCILAEVEIPHDALDIWKRAGLIRGETSQHLTFAHQIIRESILNQLGSAFPQEKLHRACATSLLEHNASPGSIGRHLLATSAKRKAVGFIINAVKKALARNAFSEAELLLGELERHGEIRSKCYDEEHCHIELLWCKLFSSMMRITEGIPRARALTSALCISERYHLLPQSQHLLGLMLSVGGHYDEAHKAFKEGRLSRNNPLFDPKLQTQICLGEFIAYIHEGKLNQAYQSCIEALDIAPNQILRANAHRNLGAIATRNKDFSEAHKHFEAAMLLFTSSNHLLGIATTLNESAGLAQEEDKPKRAEEMYRRASLIYMSLGHGDEIITKMNLGLLLTTQKSWKKLHTEFNNILPQLRRNSRQNLKILAHACLTLALLGLNDMVACELELRRLEVLDVASHWLLATTEVLEQIQRLAEPTAPQIAQRCEILLQSIRAKKKKNTSSSHSK